jgi:leucyl aminopeptidase
VGDTSPQSFAAEVDARIGGMIQRLITDGDATGTIGQLAIIPVSGIPARRVAVIGLGDRATFSPERARVAAAEAIRALRERGCRTVGVPAIGRKAIGAATAATATVEGAVLGAYRFDRHKSASSGKNVETVLVVAPQEEAAALEAGVARGLALANATAFARDLQNEPANILTPSELAARARARLLPLGIEVEIFGREWMERQGMRALLGVSQGSPEPPQFIVMRYRVDDPRPAVGLVGKGITFDTGGVSIKPAEGMELMKTDMSGAAAVIGAMEAIAQTHPRRNVVGIVPTCENAVDGAAQRPGDVVRAFNGKTIEVINTDAEGRLILADALGWGVAQGLSPIVNLATLTGAISVALGKVRTGVFTNSKPVYDGIAAAGDACGERMWQMPLDSDYFDQIRSDVADMKNTGGRAGGACTAAALLEQMVGGTPWAHLDIAGTARGDAVKGYVTKGGTGVGVRTLVHFVEGQSA